MKLENSSARKRKLETQTLLAITYSNLWFLRLCKFSIGRVSDEKTVLNINIDNIDCLYGFKSVLLFFLVMNFIVKKIST